MTITMPAPAAIMDMLGNADAQAVLDRLVVAVTQWQQVVETEQTKRRAITADECLWLAAIEADCRILMTYLDRSFDERAANFRELFGKLDRAMAGDGTEVADILGAITTLAMRSPFSDLKDAATVTAKLRDRDTEW